MRLAHARIVTSDVPALSRFYESLLTIAPTGAPEYAVFTTPTGKFAISGKRNLDLPQSAGRSVILDFEVEDVDWERQRLADLKIAVVSEPQDQPWGYRSMLFRDPDGNLLNFFSPIRRAEG